MTKITSKDQHGKRFPHLGKLSVAILESLVESVLGDEAIKQIKAPLEEKELRDSLAKVLIETEKRFAVEHEDKELCDAILDLPMATLPSIQQAVRNFIERPTDPVLESILQERVSTDFQRLSEERVQQAVSIYMMTFREELVSVSSDVRDKLRTLAVISMEQNTGRIADTVDELLEAYISREYVPRPGSAPPVPSLIVGREDDLKELKKRLGITTTEEVPTNVQAMTAIRGWPGVGKTTIASAIAHDPEITQAFPDGVLWVSLGQEPNLLSEMATWGRGLGTDELLRAQTLEEAQAQLAALLRNKRRLLIIDDVWVPEHAIPFNVGGRDCATLITTRLNDVAQAIAPTPDDIYRLSVLTDEKALELLQKLAPKIIQNHPEESMELVHELEGLPLALQVAGRLLHTEQETYGFGVAELITELREGARLLKEAAPADRADLANETTPTIAVLLDRSIDRLSHLARDCYAYLGVFAPKPATFDLAAMRSIWQVEDPKPIARTLVDRGLLEYVREMKRYQMHALLVMHAKSLLTDENE